MGRLLVLFVLGLVLLCAECSAVDLDCDLCLGVLTVAYDVVEANATAEEVLEALDYLCDQEFPSGLPREGCLEVSTLLSYAVGSLADFVLHRHYTPLALCQMSGMCVAECCTTPNEPEQFKLMFGETLDSMRVVWVTALSDSNMLSEVYYGPSSTGLSEIAQAEPYVWSQLGWRGILHTALLTGLQADTLYSYQVRSLRTGVTSPILQFRSRSADPSSIDVLLIGDMGSEFESNATIARLTQHMAQYDFLLHNGDIGYSDGVQTIEDTYCRKIETFSRYLPVMMTPGNHEIVDDFAMYRNRYNRFLPHADPVNFYYTFAQGPVTFVMMNSESPINTPFIPDAEVTWLAETLPTIDRTVTPWIVVLFHRPMYCSLETNYTEYSQCGEFAEYLRTRVEKILYMNGVDLVINAHQHYTLNMYAMYDGQVCSYSMDSPGCPVYIISGNAGNREGLMPTYPAPFVRFGASHYGYTALHVNQTHFRVDTIESYNDKLMDTFTITK